jgi:rod shape-determining protein MreD
MKLRLTVSPYFSGLCIFVVASVLAIIPLPLWVVNLRPEFVPMVVIYWVSASPSRVGVGTAWFLGLFLDVLEGSVLGINGLGLVLVAYFASSQHRRFRMLRPLQQACTVVIVIALYLTLLQWLRVINGESIYNGFSYLFGSLTSGLLWPLFVYLFSFTRPRTAR